MKTESVYLPKRKLCESSVSYVKSEKNFFAVPPQTETVRKLKPVAVGLTDGNRLCVFYLICDYELRGCFSRLALISPINSGCALFGRDLNSGWN